MTISLFCAAGNGWIKRYEKLLKTKPICLSVSAASCAVARGIIPGSDQLVLSSAAITNMNRTAPMTGIAGVTSTVRYGQLQTHTAKHSNRSIVGSLHTLHTTQNSDSNSNLVHLLTPLILREKKHSFIMCTNPSARDVS